jgi:hypothetical protein
MASTIAGAATGSTVQGMRNVSEATKEAPTVAAENFAMVTTDLAKDAQRVATANPTVMVAPTASTSQSPAQIAASADVSARQAAQDVAQNKKAAQAGAEVASKITMNTKPGGAEGTEAIIKQRAKAMEIERTPVKAPIVDAKPAATPANDPGTSGGSVEDIAAMPKSKGPSRRVGAVAAVAVSTGAGASGVTSPAVDAAFGKDASPAAAKGSQPVAVTAVRSSRMSEYRPATAHGVSSFFSKLGITGSAPDVSAVAVFKETAAATGPVGVISAPIKAVTFNPGQPIAGTQGAPSFAAAEPEKVAVNAGQKPQTATPSAARKAAPVYGMGPSNTH